MGYLQQQQMDAGTTRDVADVTPAAPAKVMRGVGTFVLTAKQFWSIQTQQWLLDTVASVNFGTQCNHPAPCSVYQVKYK